MYLDIFVVASGVVCLEYFWFFWGDDYEILDYRGFGGSGSGFIFGSFFFFGSSMFF